MYLIHSVVSLTSDSVCSAKALIRLADLELHCPHTVFTLSIGTGRPEQTV